MSKISKISKIRKVGDKVLFNQPTINFGTKKWGHQWVQAVIAEVSDGRPYGNGVSYKVFTEDGEPSILDFLEEQFKDLPIKK